MSLYSKEFIPPVKIKIPLLEKSLLKNETIL